MDTPKERVYDVWDLAEDLASILMDIIQLKLPIDDIAFTLQKSGNDPNDYPPIPEGSNRYYATWAARPGIKLDETTIDILNSSIPVREVVLTDSVYQNWEKVARHLALRAKG